METALVLLGSPAGQALLGVAVSKVLEVLGGGDPERAAADFLAACESRQGDIAAWNAANPA